MRSFLVCLLLILAAALPAAAQHVHEHGGATGYDGDSRGTAPLPHGIPRFDGGSRRTLQSARSGRWEDPETWSKERVPGPEDVVVIAAGTSVTVRRQAVCRVLSVERRATLAVSPVDTATILCETLLVHENGTLQIGTDQAPIAADRGVRLVFRDTIIDTTEDPEQYGHGLLALGRVIVRGAPKTPFVRLARSPRAGDKTLLLAAPPEGWRPGDRLALPDSRMVPVAWSWLHNGQRGPEFHVEEAVIAAISGANVTLQAPLRYDHPASFRPKDRAPDFPHALNLTRNVELRSENPAGVRGHTLFTHNAVQDIRWCAFVGLGRTRTDDLNDTAFGSGGAVKSIGSNEIGRYPLHDHHLHAERDAQGRAGYLVGCVVDGSPKWGVVIHNTDSIRIKSTIAYNCVGACFVTEDGSEIDNEFDNCFALLSRGHPIWLAKPRANPQDLAFSGAGFWLRGGNNVVKNCVASSVAEAGFDYASYALVPISMPKFPGARRDVANETVRIEHTKTPPLRTFADCEAYGASAYGLRLANVHGARVQGLTTWNVKMGLHQFLTSQIAVSGSRFTGDPRVDYGWGYGGEPPAYTAPTFPALSRDFVNFEKCRFEHLARGATIDLRSIRGRLKDCEFVACVEGLGVQAGSDDWQPFLSIDNCTFTPGPGRPLRAIALRDKASGGKSLPPGAGVQVRSYQGRPGDDFTLLFTPPANRRTAPREGIEAGAVVAPMARL